MYVQKLFEETRVEVLHALMDAHPLGTLVTLTADGLEANHIPFKVYPQASHFGTLRGHVSRSNPVWRSFQPQVETLIVFQGPNTYISPTWYPCGEKSGKVAPSWSYAVVHAYGTLRIVEDGNWLMGLLEDLTAQNENGRATPWKVADAPADFTRKLLDAIVGIEIEITRLVGKWQVGQQRPAVDRERVMAELLLERKDSSTAMAELVGRAMRGE